MLCISEKVYRGLAQALLMSVGDAEFWNSNVGYCDGQYDYSLTVTAILYRDEKHNLTDIIPVWWNCQVGAIHQNIGIEAKNYYTIGPVEVISTNFSWTDFKKYIFEENEIAKIEDDYLLTIVPDEILFNNNLYYIGPQF